MKHVLSYLALLSLAGCGNPGGISDSEYASYKELGAPKLLYSCTSESSGNFEAKRSFQCGADKNSDCYKNFKATGDTTVNSVAGVGAAVTYNKLLSDAKASCEGNFKVLDSKS